MAAEAEAYLRRGASTADNSVNGRFYEDQISPMLAVSDGNAAIEFYKTAFGAALLWHLNGGGHIVAGLSIDGAQFSSPMSHLLTAPAAQTPLVSRR